MKQYQRIPIRENATQKKGIDFGRFLDLPTSNRIQVNGLNLHHIKGEMFLDCTGDFEAIGSMLIGEIEQKTNIRLRNVEDFVIYINAIDVDYYCEDIIFTGRLYKLNIHQFNKLKRSQYGKGTVFKEDIVEYTCNKCYIPTSGTCFIKRIKKLSNKDSTEKILIFIWTEQRRSNVMISARIQPTCKKRIIKIGCYDGFRVCPGNITGRNNALKKYKNILCLISKSNGISYNEAIEEIKTNFKVVDNVISDEHAESSIKFEYKPKKIIFN